MRHALLLAVSMSTLLPLRATANDSTRTWTATDTVIEASFAAALGADWLQTRQITHAGLETNPILGKHASRSKVDAYFATSLAGHALIAAALPRPYRTVWQCIWIGIETEVVRQNYELG